MTAPCHTIILGGRVEWFVRHSKKLTPTHFMLFLAMHTPYYATYHTARSVRMSLAFKKRCFMAVIKGQTSVVSRREMQ